MTRTGLQIITGALKTLTVLGEGATPTAAGAADALVWLNQLIDRWGTDGLTMPVQLRTVKTLSADTASYTIGTGGDIAIAVPVQIERAGLVLDSAADPVFEVPLRIFTDAEYAAIPDKDLRSLLASGIYFDHAFTSGLGTIRPYPVPLVGTTQLVLYTRQALTAFADLSTSYTLPAGLADALELNLALKLARPWGAEITPDLRQDAREALADYQRSVSAQQQEALCLDPLFRGDTTRRTWGRRDFLSGGWD